MSLVDALLFYLGLSIPGMGAVASQIFLQCVHFGLFYVYFIVPSKYCWFILTICIYGRYLGVQTMVQFLVLMLWQPIYE